MKRITIALILLIVAPTLAYPDVIKLKNGDVIRGKIVKEMNELVKIRMPRRGKIVTTFLNRGTIKSIEKTPDEENREIFKEAGIRNPSRDFEPTYYGGSVTVAGTGAPARGARIARRTQQAAARKRGVEARKERFETAASGRFGKTGAASSQTTGTSTTTSSGSGFGTSTAASPTTSGTATTSTFGQ